MEFLHRQTIGRKNKSVGSRGQEGVWKRLTKKGQEEILGVIELSITSLWYHYKIECNFQNLHYKE